MNHSSLTVTLLTYILIVSINTLCQPKKQISQFWSDSAQFSIPITQNTTLSFSYQTYNLTFANSYDRNSNIQYAFAIKDMSTLTGNILYFDLLVLKTFQANLVLNFIYETNKWSIVTYNYWISFRNDVTMAIQTFTESQITVSPEGNNQLTTSLANFKDSKNIQKYAVIVFLNGIRYNSQNQTNTHSLSFTLLEQYVNLNKLVVGFTTRNDLPVSSLTLSYIIYAPQILQFASYGGVINHLNFKSKHHKNLQYLLPQSNFYYIFGLSTIVASTDEQNSFTFQSTISNNYDFNYSIKDWEQLDAIQISYIIIGQMPAKICQKDAECQSLGLTYIHNDQCLKICPFTAQPFTFIDGGIECRDCPQNMYYSAPTGQCQCLNGFERDNSDVCISQYLKLGAGVTKSISEDNQMLDFDSASSKSSYFSQAQQCLKLINIQQNNKNLYITLRASTSILSDAHSLDKDYLKIKFSNDESTANSYYCSISQQNVKQYDCLLLYTNGVPTKTFDIKFQCSVEAKGTSKICAYKIPYQSIRH